MKDREVNPPARHIVGAPIDGQLDYWIDEGLPATCPVCDRTWKFVFMVEMNAWVCPGFEANCACYVTMEDMMRSYDGGHVMCGLHEMVPPHVILPGDVLECRRLANRLARLRIGRLGSL